MTAAATAAWLVACGSDRHGSPASGAGGSSDQAFDASADAELPLDAARDDAHEPDGQTIEADTQPSEVVTRCTLRFSPPSTLVRGGLSPDDAPTMTATVEGAWLSYVAFDGGRAQLLQLLLPVDPSGVVRSVELPAHNVDRHAPRAALLGDRVVSVWSEPRVQSDRSALWSRAVERASFAPGPEALIDDDLDTHACSAFAAGQDGRAIVVYVPRTGSPGVARLLDASGVASGAPTELPSFTGCTGAPALAPLGAGYALAWVDRSPEHRVLVQRLDAHGAPVGERAMFDTEGGARGGLDLASSDAGGALVWDVLVAGARPEVRLRTFDGQLAPTAEEHVVSVPPDLGLLPAVTAYRGGYAVLYRSPQTGTSRLRLAFTRHFGELVGVADVGSLSDVSAPGTLRAAPDGSRAWLAWLDREGDSTAYSLFGSEASCD